MVRLRLQASSQKDELAAAKTRMAAQVGEIAALREELGALREKLGEAETRLNVEAMHAEGLRAQGLYLVSLGAEAPRASEPSGQHYADGEVKTRLAVVYEEAFDRKGHEMGISDPPSTGRTEAPASGPPRPRWREPPSGNGLITDFPQP